jgi:sigma-B regulation protein RsbU (phosphoserine phosphatase)
MPSELPALPSDGQLFDEVPCGLLVVSTAGVILKVNRTFCNWVGYAAEELVQQVKLQSLFSMGARIFHQTHWLPMLEMQGSLSEVKLDMRKRDGQMFPALLNVIRRQSDAGSYDEVSVVVALERNQYERELLAARQRADELLRKERQTQTALRASQARLQQAMQVGAVFVWDIDIQSMQRRYSDEVALLLGYASPRPIDAGMFLGSVAQKDRAGEQAALDLAFATAEPYHWSYRLQGIDGVQRVVVASGQAFPNDEGKLVEFVGTLVDVTETYRLREAAEDRAAFAEQMVGIVSHDLRNPLQAVATATQVLNKGAGRLSAENSERMLDVIERSTNRAQRLIADLLDFTAVRLGKGLTVHRSSVDFHEAVANVLLELADAFPGRTIDHVRAGSGATTADMDRIAQLLGNLVGNAVVYGQPNGTITVTSAVLPDYVTLTVHNWGQPIEQEKQAALFEPMVRGDTVDSSTRSVGLGLFIVRAIAHAHGGSVSLRSDASEGTEFVFKFSREHLER